MKRCISSLLSAALVAVVLTGGGSVFAQEPTADAPAVVDLNQADAATLTTLPGIGPARAEAIVKYRAEHGPFQRLEDLTSIRGIGESMIPKLKDRARVSPDGV